MANDAVYLITHKDIPLNIKGANGGAEMAALALAKFLVKAGKRVFFAGQINSEEQVHEGVQFWSLGKDYNITKTLNRIREVAPYHLIAASKAHSILESRYEELCLSRIFMSHDQHGNDAGVNLSTVAQIADYLVCVSQAHADEFKKANVPNDKLKVIHNGVDLSIFQKSSPEERDYNKLIFAGALVRDKGVDLLIQSYAHLKQKYPALSLDIYGSASLWNRESYINEDDIQKQIPGVVFHGKKTQPEIAQAFQTAGICVIPSIWFEAFPLTAIEAQVTGCPVLAFAVGGLKEAIRHNQTGALLEQISVESLTHSLDCLLSNKAKLKEFSKNALMLQRPYYNWERVANAIIELAEKSASKNKNTAPSKEHFSKNAISISTMNNNKFERLYGVKDFVFCLAPFLESYNQLTLLKALKQSDLTIVLASSKSHVNHEYLDALKSFKRNGKTLIIEQLSEEYSKEALDKAKIHVLLAELEPPALPSLEAIYKGKNIVVSKNHPLKNQFQTGVFTCSPQSKTSIKTAIEAAFHSPQTKQPHLISISNWKQSVTKIIESYNKVYSSK